MIFGHVKTGWGFITLAIFMGLLLLAVDFREHIGLSGLALSVWAAGWILFRLDVAQPSEEKKLGRIHRTAEGLEIELPRSLPEFRVGFSLLATWSCFYAAWLLHDDPLWLVGGVMFGLVSLLFLPDGLRGLLRDAKITITSDGMHHRGWTAQSWLDWDDVESSVAFGINTRQGQVQISLREGAPRRTKHRFFVFPIDHWAWGPNKRRRIVIASAALDDPGPVAELFRALSAFTIEARQGIIDLWARRMRDGSLRSDTYRFGSEARSLVPLTAWRVDL